MINNKERTMHITRTSVTATLLALAFAIRATAADVLPVAVFDFQSTDEGMRDLGPKVATLINANLSADPNLVTVERADLDKILGEQELGLSGTVSADSAAKVGHLTGAKVLVTGRVFKTGNELYLVAKIIGTETSRVYGELSRGPESASLGDLSESLAKKISGIITSNGATLVAKVVPRDERISNLVASLPAAKRPSVSVKIAERHFGTAVIDPAAETELAYLLQKAGFTVVDDKSATRPDIEITGEAFSAFGLRKGNLISCRSRIELKVQQRESGKILTQDSETSVAMDIAEQIAAKTALQNAADQIAERVLPRLAQ